MSICYCFGGLLHLNVSGALEVMHICHFQSPKFNILLYFDSFKNTTRRSLELLTIDSLLSLEAMKTFVWLIGVFGFDWDREWHQHHGSWCMKSIATRVRGYIFLCKKSVGEAWRNAYYMEMFFFHLIGYPYLQKCIVVLEKDVPYDQ
jgi:hypothetical protein